MRAAAASSEPTASVAGPAEALAGLASGEQREKILPLQVLHDVTGSFAFFLEEVGYFHDVLVGDAVHRSGFGKETSDGLGVFGQRRVKDLERDFSVQPRVTSEPHRTHAADAKNLDELVRSVHIARASGD